MREPPLSATWACVAREPPNRDRVTEDPAVNAPRRIAEIHHQQYQPSVSKLLMKGGEFMRRTVSTRPYHTEIQSHWQDGIGRLRGH